MSKSRKSKRAISALTIAGSDSSGGAGIQADLATFRAFGVHGASCVTMVTAQTTEGVFSTSRVDPDLVRQQIYACIRDMDVRAIKIGALFDEENVHAVADALEETDAPIVVDPVLLSTSGVPLLSRPGLFALLERLLPRVEVITPNIPELRTILAEAFAEEQVDISPKSVRRLDARWVLIKGGHREGPPTDVLVGRDESHELTEERISGRFRGTGCTLSSAIAAELARDKPMLEAVKSARAYLRTCMRNALRRAPAGYGDLVLH